MWWFGLTVAFLSAPGALISLAIPAIISKPFKEMNFSTQHVASGLVCVVYVLFIILSPIIIGIYVVFFPIAQLLW